MRLTHRPLLYENLYVWFVLVSALDIMLTTVVLALGGHEVNGLAARAIECFGLPGMVAFKFSLVVFIVCLCEFIGQRNSKLGRKLAEWSVALTCVPLVLALIQISQH